MGDGHQHILYEEVYKLRFGWTKTYPNAPESHIFHFLVVCFCYFISKANIRVFFYVSCMLVAEIQEVVTQSNFLIQYSKFYALYKNNYPKYLKQFFVALCIYFLK